MVGKLDRVSRGGGLRVYTCVGFAILLGESYQNCSLSEMAPFQGRRVPLGSVSCERWNLVKKTEANFFHVEVIS